MTPSAKTSSTRSNYIRRAAYLLAIAAVTIFLWKMGGAPWLHAAQHWPIMIALAALSAFGLAVQAMAFRLMAPPDNRPVFQITLAIWAISAALSVVAPFMAGIAARTTLLVRHGMSLKTCGLASLRQVWLGLEYALLLSALSLPFANWGIALNAGGGCALAWLVMLALRLKASSCRFDRLEKASGRFVRLIHAFSAPVPAQAHPWFALQVLTMSAVYLVGFNGFGAEISAFQAIALAGLTVVLSLIAFVPNGLGITDIAWVALARNAGLELEHAVAIAIVLRFGHLLASIALAMLLHKQLTKKHQQNSGNNSSSCKRQ